jgi:hypothetical protein
MKDYIIEVNNIEDLQTLNEVQELEKIFEKAQSTIVNGEKVLLVRKTAASSAEKFDELSTLEQLQQYRKSVFRYINPKEFIRKKK